MKVKGTWKYYYRAVDKRGNPVVFFLAAKCDTETALRYLTKAIKRSGKPGLVNIDKSGANKAAVTQYNSDNSKRIIVRQCKYLNNIVEQGHRRMKRITRPMLGFKNFNATKSTLTVIEVVAMIKKGQTKKNISGQLSCAYQFYALAA
jgi:putative transposase